MIQIKKLSFFTSISLILLVCHSANAQFAHDTTITKDRKNIIRYNPTPAAIAGVETFVMGYERVIAPHKSVSVNFGNLKFRQFVDLDLEGFEVETNRNSRGYIVVADFRMYLKKRNRGLAPDGLYWGPYMNYYQYNHEIGIIYTDPASLTETDINLTSNLSLWHFGVELGYQFVIKKRFTIDMIFIGPSWGRYHADFSIDGNLDLNEESDLYKAVYKIFEERLPGLSSIIDDRSVSKSGDFTTNSIGMRYLIQFGFLF